jgi:hypothetical protein
VVLSSQAHRVADIDLDDLNFEHQAYNPFVACRWSTTANSPLAAELTGGTVAAAFERPR